MTAGINTKPPIGLLRFTPRPRDAEDIPLRSIVRTPLGHLAEVLEYRGFRRGHRVRLVCQYVTRVNTKARRFDVFQILPELVVVVRLGPKEAA